MFLLPLSTFCPFFFVFALESSIAPPNIDYPSGNVTHEPLRHLVIASGQQTVPWCLHLHLVYLSGEKTAHVEISIWKIHTIIPQGGGNFAQPVAASSQTL